MEILWLLADIWIVALILFILIHFGYFLVVFILAKVKWKKIRKAEDFTPFISILIPCYNVGSVINYKIKNTLEIDYPKDKFEVIFVESGSIDNTYSILSQYATQGSIKLVRQPQRLGKPSAINCGLSVCKSDIVVLTDADATLDRKAIKELVKNFADETVGAVVGNTTITPSKSTASKMNHLFYEIFRQKARVWESKIDSASFWTGHLCAFRKSIVERLDEDIVNEDRYILLKTRSMGYRCICETLAHVYQADPETFLHQIMQKRRTTAGTLQGTLRFKYMLFNSRYGLFGTIIMPAYLLRVVSLPILLLTVESLSPVVAYLFLWSSTWLFWLGIVAIILLLPSLFEGGRQLLSSLFYGFIVQIAVVAGLVDYIFRRYTVLWKRMTV